MGIRKSHRDALIMAIIACLFGGVAIARPPSPAVQPPISNSSCMECHGDKTLTTTNAASKEISLFVDLAKLQAPFTRQILALVATRISLQNIPTITSPSSRPIALNAEEKSTLAKLCRKIATQQGLAPGVHPGYGNL